MAINRRVAYYGLILPVTFMRGECLPCHIANYKKQQYWPAEQLQQYQEHHLASLLAFSQRHSPHYNSLFRDANLRFEDGFSWDAFRRIPQLTKADLVEKPDQLMTWKKFYSHSKTTGGSTGQAVTLKKNPGALARERAATARAYEWAGVLPGHSQVRYWGVPIETTRRLSSVAVDLIANRRRVSAFGFDDESLTKSTQMLQRYEPIFLYGYASLLVELSHFVRRRRMQLPKSIKCVITTSEVLTDEMRDTIQSTLNVPVFNEYGCGEVGSIAHECEYGSMHTMSENLIVEILDDAGQPADTGELVVTDLHNFATPLIRYRLGDYASTTTDECKCGRQLPALKGIHGRAYDMISTPSGKQYHPEAVMYIFELLKDRNLGVRQFQVVQDKLNNLRIKLVFDSGRSRKEAEAMIVEQVHATLSPEFMVSFDYVDQIERENSGKLRLVKVCL